MNPSLLNFVAVVAATPLKDTRALVGEAIYTFLIIAFVFVVARAVFQATKGQGGRITTVLGAIAALAFFAIPEAGDAVITATGDALTAIATKIGNGF